MTFVTLVTGGREEDLHRRGGSTPGMEHVNSPLPVGVRRHVALIFCRVRLTIPLFMRLAEHLPLLTTKKIIMYKNYANSESLACYAIIQTLCIFYPLKLHRS